MEKKYYKALNFDLDTHKLQEYYSETNYRQAYNDLRRFFRHHDFAHRQGSGYISEAKLGTADIFDLMDELSCQFTWAADCVSKIDVTNIGRQHDLGDLLKLSTESVPMDSVILIDRNIDSNDN